MCLPALPARAQMPDKRWTLTELIDRALERDGDVASDRWKVESAAARRRQAAAAKILPRLRIDSESGLVPDAMGNVFNPPSDTTGIPSLGPFARAELQFVQPLYPFSLGRHLDEAATRGSMWSSPTFRRLSWTWPLPSRSCTTDCCWAKT